MRKYVVYPWFVCALGALFYCYEYLLRVTPSVMSVDIMTAYKLDATAFGHLAAFYYYAYTPMQLPVGILMDRYGPGFLLTLACAICTGGTYVFTASTDALWMAQIGRFMIGFGSAFAFVGILKLATMWLPVNRFGFITGISVTFGTMGAMSGDVLLTKMVHMAGWRETLMELFYIGCVLTVLIFIFIRDKLAPQRAEVKMMGLKEIMPGLIEILVNPQIWLIGVYGALHYLSLSAFAELWGIPYLERAHGLTPHKAAMANAFVFLGWAVGGPLYGMVSDYIRLRRMPIVIGGGLAFIMITTLLYVPGLSYTVICLLLFGFGVFPSAQILTFAMGKENSSTKVAGTAMAVTNMLIMTGGMVFQPLIGKLLDYHSGGALADTTHVYSVADFQFAMIVLPIAMVMGSVLAFLSRETHCRPKDA